MQLKPLAALLTTALGLLAAGGATAAVTDQMIETSAKSGQEVLSWGLGTQGQR